MKGRVGSQTDDGWTGGQTFGWLNRCLDRDGCLYGLDRQVDGWMDRCTDGLVDKGMHVWMDG